MHSDYSQTTNETKESNQTQETKVAKEITKCRGQRKGKVLAAPFPVKGREGIPPSLPNFFWQNVFPLRSFISDVLVP